MKEKEKKVADCLSRIFLIHKNTTGQALDLSVSKTQQNTLPPTDELDILNKIYIEYIPLSIIYEMN